VRGNPGRGALAGLCFGVAGVALVILLPPAVQNDWYEIADPLVYMGLPMVLIATCLGAVVGVRGRKRQDS
jgi:drug/metabolite transporter (DMT)-like permease